MNFSLESYPYCLRSYEGGRWKALSAQIVLPDWEITKSYTLASLYLRQNTRAIHVQPQHHYVSFAYLKIILYGTKLDFLM